MKLVDTDVAIDYLRDDARAASVLEPLSSASVILVASEQTRFELLAGMRAGERAKTEDFFIAATALDLGADLLTRNVRHFPMLAGLRPAY